MADSVGVYGVSAADIAAELLTLFPVGFTQAQRPSLATVEGWIADADAYVDTVVMQVVAVNEDLTDAATRLARRWVISDVKDRVREAATNLSAADIVALRQTSAAKTILDQLMGLATSEIAAELAKLKEAQLESPRVGMNPTTAQRPLLVDDCDLDPRAPRFPFGSSNASGIDWGRY
jgi:hypothetical protein